MRWSSTLLMGDALLFNWGRIACFWSKFTMLADYRSVHISINEKISSNSSARNDHKGSYILLR